jgi:hypothetical protein
MKPGDPSDIDLACFLARLHKATPLVFWRSSDWSEMHGVATSRLDGDRVSVTTRPIGRGYLAGGGLAT